MSSQGTGESDEDECRLPADTMLVLQQFLYEKEMREHTGELVQNDFEENWQLSQFWYNTQTKERLTFVVKYFREHFESVGIEPCVALVSCPSLYSHIKAVHNDVTLFEFDERFTSIGSNFRHFDYNRAIEEDYLDDFREKFDIVIADPPFLSEECIEKISIVVRKISKKDCKIILCSGFVVREWAKKHLTLDICKFKPEHERNLGNEFSSYANFNLDDVLAKVM
ncbi:protein-lysine N-methyltransferase CG9154 [Topomyia yanbarensis]|uniref:protein-lysine N-methyltransferase CG9154 n=1 Tax=Topomyia yanbarensis TaxID=2498891 RepID=UPI00273CAEFD|nr:protein-lysine N-methyltransferase CG9154 [Topomyia yanbarensis]XP_058819105.1 protein-lysine N-methyltransferase CG9154 [Topomyia yanbarensis]